jgi:hypothetical protein
MQRIQALPQATPLMISAITLGEIEYGLSVVSGNHPVEQQALREFVDHHLPMVLEVRKTTRTYYGMIRASLFEKYAPREIRRRGLRPEQLVDPVRRFLGKGLPRQRSVEGLSLGFRLLCNPSS